MPVRDRKAVGWVERQRDPTNISDWVLGLRFACPNLRYAVADPAKRPRIVAEMRKVDPEIITQDDLLMPYLQLGEVDLVYRIMFEALERDRNAWVHNWDVMNTWSAESSAFRRDPRFPELARRMGLLDYWKQYGFPDRCRAGDRDVPVVCVS